MTDDVRAWLATKPTVSPDGWYTATLGEFYADPVADNVETLIIKLLDEIDRLTSERDELEEKIDQDRVWNEY